MLKSLLKKTKSKKNPVVHNIDFFDSKSIEGWVVNNSTSKPALVEAVINDYVVASVLADGFREDVKQTGIGNGYCSFNLNIAEVVVKQDTKLLIKADGCLISKMNASELGVAKARLTDYRYCIGDVSLSNVKGWACLSEKSDRKVSVNIEINGQLLETSIAKQYRQDLLEHGIGDGCFGFEVSINADSLPQQDIELVIYLDGIEASRHAFTAQEVQIAKNSKQLQIIGELIQAEINVMEQDAYHINEALNLPKGASAGVNQMLLQRMAELTTRMSVMEQKVLDALKQK